MIVQEQFLYLVTVELSTQLRERKPKFLEDLGKMSDQYLMARETSLVEGVRPRNSSSAEGVFNRKSGQGGSGEPGRGFRKTCYHCRETGHVKADCPSLGKGFSKENVVAQSMFAQGADADGILDSKYSSTGAEDSKYSSTGSEDSKYSSTGGEDSKYSSTGAEDSKYSSTGAKDSKYSSTGSEDSKYSSIGAEDSKYSSTGAVNGQRVHVYRDTGSSRTFVNKKCRGRCSQTKVYRSSFIPHASTLWNRLPQALKDASSLNDFKRKCKDYLFTPRHNQPQYENMPHPNERVTSQRPGSGSDEYEVPMETIQPPTVPLTQAGDDYQELRPAVYQKKRREALSLKFAKSLLNSPTFRHWLPPSRSDIHGRCLKGANQLDIPLTKTRRYKTSSSFLVSWSVLIDGSFLNLYLRTPGSTSNAVTPPAQFAGRLSIDGISNLRLTGVTIADEDQYRCSVTATTSPTTMVNLHIFQQPTRPQVQVQYDPQQSHLSSVPLNTTVTFTCTSTGGRTPATLTWYGKPASATPTYTSSNDSQGVGDATLTFNFTTAEYGVTYSVYCRATGPDPIQAPLSGQGRE
ncbi:hypothetical protein Bbelb_079350 [Branchiostoma belcheri]|nr:hypothetical protein Bbelb_079350 [Branchiostoma belcheri]